MKKSVMKRWVKALRSGKYKQTKYKLHDGKGYCCLGVLCEVLKAPKFVNQFGENLYGEFLKANLTTLPASIKTKAEMRSHTGILPKPYKTKFYKKNGGFRQTLTELNDGGLSFKQIANIIERNYKEL